MPKESDRDEETVDPDKMNLWWTNFFTPEQVEPMPEDFKKKTKGKGKIYKVRGRTKINAG